MGILLRCTCFSSSSVGSWSSDGRLGVDVWERGFQWSLLDTRSWSSCGEVRLPCSLCPEGPGGPVHPPHQVTQWEDCCFVVHSLLWHSPGESEGKSESCTFHCNKPLYLTRGRLKTASDPNRSLPLTRLRVRCTRVFLSCPQDLRRTARRRLSAFLALAMARSTCFV